MYWVVNTSTLYLPTQLITKVIKIYFLFFFKDDFSLSATFHSGMDRTRVEKRLLSTLGTERERKFFFNILTYTWYT
jgi:hypothetical protein